MSSFPLMSCNQIRCAGVLLLITRSSTTKWAYTDSSILLYNITGHLVGGGGGGIFCRTRQQPFLFETNVFYMKAFFPFLFLSFIMQNSIMLQSVLCLISVFS